MDNKRTWLESLQPGDEVCDCCFAHTRIVSIDLVDDVVILESDSGSNISCSPFHCIDPVDHEWEHPEGFK